MSSRSQLTLNQSSAETVKWEPYAAASTGRKLRVWVRGLHTGEALGIIGQTIAGLASLGGCFLVWTGVAMAWRRFRYRKRDAENTNTVEYPTTPEKARPLDVQFVQPNFIETSKEPRIEMEEANTTATNGHVHNGVHEKMAAEWSSTPPYKDDSVLILYATVTGTAETVANKLAAELRSDGLAARVRDMAQCQPDVLTQADCVLLVVSTYGDGEPPEDARPFWEAVVGADDLDLTGIKYSVLALGNTTFDQFCKCGRDFDAALERHGAIRMYPRVDCDVDYEVPAKHWLDGVRARLVVEDRSALSA
jgi:flavodoxin